MDVVKLIFLMAQLNILSWNVRGIMTSTLPLSDMIQDYNVDIAIICEHRLRPQHRQFLASVHDGYDFLSKESESINCYNRNVRGRAASAYYIRKS